MRRVALIAVTAVAAALAGAAPASAGEFGIALPATNPDGTTPTHRVGETSYVHVGLQRSVSTEGAAVVLRVPAQLNPRGGFGEPEFTCGSWAPDGADLVMSCTWNASASGRTSVWHMVYICPTASSGSDPYTVRGSISGAGDTNAADNQATLPVTVAEGASECAPDPAPPSAPGPGAAPPSSDPGPAAPPGSGSGPPPPPPGSDPGPAPSQSGSGSGSGPAPPPEANRSETAAPVSGEVYVRLRGSKRFVRLTGERSIPDGSEVDARNGTVALTVSAGTGGGVRTAVIRWGRFIVDQDAAAEPLTRLILTDALAGCGSAGRKGTRASAAARKNAGKRSRRKRRGAKQRRLWVKEDGGRWQTKGSYASATVEGTEWTTTDLCDRTTVAVTDGTVHVRDIARRRTVTVRRGGSYTARRPDGRRTARR